MTPIRSTVCGIIAAILVSAGAHAVALPSTPVAFSIPRQPLQDALTQFGRQTGYQLLFLAEITSQRMAPEVVGSFTPQSALDQLLADSGLRYQFVNDRTITIYARKAPDDARISQESLEAGELRVAQAENGGASPSQAEAVPADVPQASGASADTLEEVVVHGKDLRGTDIASSATGFDISLKDTPQSVKVISSDLIQLTGLREIEDISRLDSSVTSAGQSRRDRTLELVFRGFNMDFTNGILMDGFRLLSRGMPDFSSVERMEIVKGPVSTMYGQASLAGTVNLISRKPEAAAKHEFRLEGGQWDFYRAEFDSTGAVTQDGRLRYRITGALEENGSFIDVIESDKQVVSPSLAYDLGDNTTLLLQSTLLDEGLTSYRGQPMTSEGTLPDVPRSFFFGQAWNKFERELRWVNGVLTHELPNGWKTGLNAQYNRSRNKGVAATAGYFPVQPDGSTDLASGAYAENFDMHSVEATLSGTFGLFSRRHSFFASLDHYSWKYGFAGRSNFPATSGTLFNIFDPNYNLIPPEPLDPGVPVNDASFQYSWIDRQENTGVTLQTRLQATDRFSVLIGVRLDDSKLTTDGVDTGMGSTQTVPQLGLVYAITPDLNAYVNYGETFLPQFGTVFGGASIGPETGKQIEGGLKGTWLSSRVAYSLAYFDMKRDGLSTGDPLHEGFDIPLGEQRSKGVEADLSGEIRRGWDVYLSASWLDPEFVKGDYAGLQAPNTARRALSLFSTWQPQEGPLRHFGVGVGVTHKSGIKALGFGDFPQTRLDGLDQYTVADLRLFYEAEDKRWEIFLAAQNLLDEVYYLDSAGRGDRVQAGEPRRIYGGVRLSL